MTIVVGVLCKDGIVIGSDSAATFSVGQFHTIEQPTKKIDVIGEHIIVAGTGAVGIGQRFKEIVQKSWDEKIFQGKSAVEIGKYLSRTAILDFNETHLKVGLYGALVAFCIENKFFLCEFDLNNFQPELKEIDRLWYVSMGSGQMIADPFLGFIRNTFWHQERPTCQDGIFATVWTLQHAVQVNPGGVNEPIEVAIINYSNKGQLKARILEESELQEHRQNVSDAIEHLRKYPSILQGKNSVGVPNIPG